MIASLYPVSQILVKRDKYMTQVFPSKAHSEFVIIKAVYKTEFFFF